MKNNTHYISLDQETSKDFASKVLEMLTIALIILELIIFAAILS